MVKKLVVVEVETDPSGIENSIADDVIAGGSAIGGAIIGGLLGGPAGLGIGLVAGLSGGGKVVEERKLERVRKRVERFLES